MKRILKITALALVIVAGSVPLLMNVKVYLAFVPSVNVFFISSRTAFALSTPLILVNMLSAFSFSLVFDNQPLTTLRFRSGLLTVLLRLKIVVSRLEKIN
mgnify:CR=1 FL=1